MDGDKKQHRFSHKFLMEANERFQELADEARGKVNKILGDPHQILARDDVGLYLSALAHAFAYGMSNAMSLLVHVEDMTDAVKGDMAAGDVTDLGNGTAMLGERTTECIKQLEDTSKSVYHELVEFMSDYHKRRGEVPVNLTPKEIGRDN